MVDVPARAEPGVTLSFRCPGCQTDQLQVRASRRCPTPRRRKNTVPNFGSRSLIVFCWQNVSRFTYLLDLSGKINKLQGVFQEKEFIEFLPLSRKFPQFRQNIFPHCSPEASFLEKRWNRSGKKGHKGLFYKKQILWFSSFVPKVGGS